VLELVRSTHGKAHGYPLLEAQRRVQAACKTDGCDRARPVVVRAGTCGMEHTHGTSVNRKASCCYMMKRQLTQRVEACGRGALHDLAGRHLHQFAPAPLNRGNSEGQDCRCEKRGKCENTTYVCFILVSVAAVQLGGRSVRHSGGAHACTTTSTPHAPITTT
jgi:hypothetical protein